MLPGKAAQIMDRRSRAACLSLCVLSMTRWTSRAVLIEQGRKFFFQLDSIVSWEAVFIKNSPIHCQLMPGKLVSPSPAPKLSLSSPGSTGARFHTELMEPFFVCTKLLLHTKKTGA